MNETGIFFIALQPRQIEIAMSDVYRVVGKRGIVDIDIICVYSNCYNGMRDVFTLPIGQLSSAHRHNTGPILFEMATNHLQRSMSTLYANTKGSQPIDVGKRNADERDVEKARDAVVVGQQVKMPKEHDSASDQAFTVATLRRVGDS